MAQPGRLANPGVVQSDGGIIDVNDRAGTLGSSVDRGFTDVASQPVLGILPKRWTGFGGCHCAGLASGRADLGGGDGGDRIHFCVERWWRLHRHFSFFTFR